MTRKYNLGYPKYYRQKGSYNNQVGLQIILPLTCSAIVMIFLVVVAAISSMGSATTGIKLANISTIFLVMLMLVPGVIFLILIIGLVILLGRIPGYVKYYFAVAGIYFFRFEIFTNKMSSTLVEPVLRAILVKSMITKFFQKSINIFKSNKT